MSYHTPVLLKAAIDALNIKPMGTYIDATFGGGGHSREILKFLDKKGCLLGFDQDEAATDNVPCDERFIFVRSNFKYIPNFLKFHNIDKVDGLLADLGVSSHHFDTPDRGFSFREDGPLDMRMNQKASLTASRWLMETSEDNLARAFRLYGEIGNWKKLAHHIASKRLNSGLVTIGDLLNMVSPFIDQRNSKKDLAKIFQAIRITINDEMGALQKLLVDSAKLIKPGGRLVVISYHSLEDRMVKNFLRTGNIEGITAPDIYGKNDTPFKQLTAKPIVPTEEEIANNPRSRSAKMRVGIKN